MPKIFSITAASSKDDNSCEVFVTLRVENTDAAGNYKSLDVEDAVVAVNALIAFAKKAGP